MVHKYYQHFILLMILPGLGLAETSMAIKTSYYDVSAISEAALKSGLDTNSPIIINNQ
jgi:hypothetical protein